MVRLLHLSLLGATLLCANCGARTELDFSDDNGRATSTGTTSTSTTSTGTTSTSTTSTSTTSTTGPTGPTAICPARIDTTPLTEVEIVGDGTDDGFIVEWQWQLVQQPVGSSPAEPLPADLPVTNFTPDVAGEYTLRLTVTDDDGFQDSCDTLVSAFPNETFRIELYWNPPENPGDLSDVDLHLLHPAAPAWFDEQLDCYYANCSAQEGLNLDWNVAGYSYDNPSLDLDDVDGYGPENINLVAPVVGQLYTVGVHYYDAEGMGPANAYIKIYCGQSSVDPVYLAGPTTLADGLSSDANPFWKVATFLWDGTSCHITPIDIIVSAQDAQLQP